MSLPLAEAQAQLLTVNVAISDLIAGKRITQLRVGSGNFQREYKYWNPDTLLQTLKDLREELQGIIQGYNFTTPTFRTNANFPLIVTKDL